MGLLAFFIILGILVLIHEFGHFFAARRAKVSVEEFGIGFPPRIAGWKRGNTVYSLNLIPFGGFVRLVGEQGEHHERRDSFAAAKPGRQLLILAAGVIMNYFFAIVVMSIVFGIGIRVDPTALRPDPHAVVTNQAAELTVSADGAARQAGLMSGDVVESVDGQSFANTEALVEYVSRIGYPPIRVAVKRDGQLKTVEVTARTEESGPRYGLGILTRANVRYPWYLAPWYGLMATNDIASQSVQGFWTLLRQLVEGHVSEDVTGPIGIAVITNEISRYGLVSLLQFTALLSVSLAILNILPLPALDGGRIAIRAFGWVTKRPMSQQLEGAIHTVGFYLLIAFLIYISVRDVDRFRIFPRIMSWFQ